MDSLDALLSIELQVGRFLNPEMSEMRLRRRIVAREQYTSER